MAIKGCRMKSALGLLFFFLLAALCPMDAASEPKARKSVPKRAAVAQLPVEQNTSKEDAEQGTEGVVSGAVKGVPESGKKADEKTDAAEANGFRQYAEYRSEEVEKESYGWLIFKTLIIIGLLVGGFYYFFRFVTKKTGIQLFGKDVAHVLSVIPLGQNRYLQVVDLAGKVLVLGVTDSNINYITEITEKDQIDRIRVMSARTPAPEMPTFSEFISKQIGRFLEKREAKKGHRESDEDRLEYLARQRERLKKIRGDIDGA